jgi:hypothetical protein
LEGAVETRCGQEPSDASVITHYEAGMDSEDGWILYVFGMFHSHSGYIRLPFSPNMTFFTASTSDVPRIRTYVFMG